MIHISALRKNLKTILLLLSMLVGSLFYKPFIIVDNMVGGWSSPALLSVMLFISCCGVNFLKMRLNYLHFILLALQIIFSALVFILTLPCSDDVSGGLLICALTPIAITSVVIAKLLGAKVGNIIAFSLLSNVVAAIYLPFILSEMCGGDVSTWQILQMVMPVIIIPMLLSQIMRKISPEVSGWISERNNTSLALWLVLILFIFARTANFFINEQSDIDTMALMQLLVGSLLICVVQFRVGSMVGEHFGDKVAGAQALGQKNTILAVWLASSFISPIAAIAPTAYIIWQNVVNTYRMYCHDHK